MGAAFGICHDPLQAAYLIGGKRDEDGDCAENVSASNEGSASEQSSWKIFARVVDFVSEKGGGLRAAEREDNCGHEENVAEMHVRHHRRLREVGSGAKTMECDTGNRK